MLSDSIGFLQVSLRGKNGGRSVEDEIGLQVCAGARGRGGQGRGQSSSHRATLEDPSSHQRNWGWVGRMKLIRKSNRK